MSQQPIWITEAEVAGLLTLEDSVGALESAMHLEASGAAANMPKTVLQYGNNNLHAIGAKLGNYVGTKTWAHTSGGTCPMLLLWNAANGQLAAVIEAFALGNLRTGGISGLATKWLADKDSRVAAVIGTGKQALSQVAAVAAVRAIEQVRIFSRSIESRDKFAKLVASELNLTAIACDTVPEACAGAHIVTLITRASSAFLSAAMLGVGVHVNAVGAIGLDREEFAQDLFDRTDMVCVDSPSSVRNFSAEFRKRFESSDWTPVRSLSSVIAAGASRDKSWDLSIFKAMGMGISDLALGTVLLERARVQGVGQLLHVPDKVTPRLRTVSVS